MDWIIRGTVLPRTHVIGKFPPRGGVATVETCAVALAMAGGGHPTNSYWLQGYCPCVIGRQIRVPESFDSLLSDADRDLGCGSDACMI